MNQGGFTRTNYDNCAFNIRTLQSESPYENAMYQGKYEQCNKCTNGQFWRPYDKEVIDLESELKGLTRNLSKCNNDKYYPTCPKSSVCTNTFDPSNPVILDRDVCPVINGYTAPTGNRYVMKNPKIC